MKRPPGRRHLSHPPPPYGGPGYGTSCWPWQPACRRCDKRPTWRRLRGGGRGGRARACAECALPWKRGRRRCTCARAHPRDICSAVWWRHSDSWEVDCTAEKTHAFLELFSEGKRRKTILWKVNCLVTVATARAKLLCESNTKPALSYEEDMSWKCLQWTNHSCGNNFLNS